METNNERKVPVKPSAEMIVAALMVDGVLLKPVDVMRMWKAMLDACAEPINKYPRLIDIDIGYCINGS